jgi:hypothetical protein
MRRAEIYEQVILKGSAKNSDDYVNLFLGKKVHKLVKGASDLSIERIAEDEENAPHESEA